MVKNDRLPDVDAYRATWRAEVAKKRFYSGWCHLATTLGVCSLCVAWAVSNLTRLSAAEWAFGVGAFFYANFAEYWMHRIPFHRRIRGMDIFFDRHTMEHHAFYTFDKFTCESPRDFKSVLFPAFVLVFFLGGLAFPVSWALWKFWSPNAGYLFMAIGIGYFMNYEVLHFLYHQPETSWLGRLPLVSVLKKHHRIHHEHAMMARYNFNVTYPVCDAIFGTLKNR